jgi:prevent-host-death family protein
MDVGIRELKARASELVGRAAKGETIRVTKRGKPLAQIGPVAGLEPEMPEWERRGIAEGWLKPGNGKPPKFPKRGFKVSKTIQRMMDEERGE